jgi:hypothetical protein
VLRSGELPADLLHNGRVVVWLELYEPAKDYSLLSAERDERWENDRLSRLNTRNKGAVSDNLGAGDAPLLARARENNFAHLLLPQTLGLTRALAAAPEEETGD